MEGGRRHFLEWNQWIEGSGLAGREADDERLTWPERELVRQLGEKLYGQKPRRQETRHE